MTYSLTHLLTYSLTHLLTCRPQKHASVNILAGNGFPGKGPMHTRHHPGDLWGACGRAYWSVVWVNVGMNIPRYCEITYSHLRQRACPDSPGPVLHPGDVWEVPGSFYPSCSGVQGAVKSKTLFFLFTEVVRTFTVDNWHCSEVYGSYAKYL